MDKRKLFLFGIVAAVIGVWLYFDLSQYFTLEQAKAQQLALQDTIHTHPVWASIVFFFAYVAVTALSLPGAAIMTLLGRLYLDFGGV